MRVPPPSPRPLSKDETIEKQENTNNNNNKILSPRFVHAAPAYTYAVVMLHTVSVYPGVTHPTSSR